MKAYYLILLLSILVSCGTKVDNKSKEDTNLQQTDTTSKTSQKNDGTYTLDYNNKDRYLNYGLVNGKPYDTIMGSDTVRFFYNQDLVYTETGVDYFFYKHNKHWPKQLVTNANQTVIFLERVLGEPEGTDIVGFIFDQGKFMKKVEMSNYKFWKIDLSKDYTVDELRNLIGQNTL